MAMNKVAAVPLASLAGSGLSTVYVVVNGGGLTQPCFLIRMVNATNRDLVVSFDGGTTDHEFLPQNGVLEIPSQTNAVPQAYTALWPSSLVVAVKAAGGAGTGTLYLSGYYQPQGG